MALKKRDLKRCARLLNRLSTAYYFNDKWLHHWNEIELMQFELVDTINMFTDFKNTIKDA